MNTTNSTKFNTREKSEFIQNQGLTWKKFLNYKQEITI